MKPHIKLVITVSSILILLATSIFQSIEVVRLKEENSSLLEKNNNALKSIESAQESLTKAQISFAKLSVLCSR